MDTYGCIVVFSSFVLHVILYGTIQSFGVLYVELLDDFEKGHGETSWIASLSSGLMFLFAPVSTYMEKKVGCRVLGIVGALLVSIGMALSSFIRNYIHIFYITYGLCSGIGFCLMCTAATIPVQLYFNKRRTLAYALASSGVCVGTVLTPFLIRYLLKEFGWRGTFLLMAAINSHGCVAGALLWKPYSKNKGSKKTIIHREDSWWTDVKKIYSDRAFLLFITSNMVVVLVYFVPYVMTPDVAFRRGLTKDEGAFLVTVFGLSGAVGRVVSGYLADAKPGRKALLNAGQLLGASAAIFWSAYIYDFSQFIGYAILFGFFGSSWAMLAAVLTVDIVGKQLYVVAMGLVWLHSGLFSTIGPPIAGWITDMSGSYEVTFIVAGCLFLFGAFLRIILCFHRLRLPQTLTDNIPLRSDQPVDTIEPP